MPGAWRAVATWSTPTSYAAGVSCGDVPRPVLVVAVDLPDRPFDAPPCRRRTEKDNGRTPLDPPRRGISLRHLRHCQSRSGHACVCRASYQAQVFTPASRKSDLKDFPHGPRPPRLARPGEGRARPRNEARPDAHAHRRRRGVAQPLLGRRRVSTGSPAHPPRQTLDAVSRDAWLSSSVGSGRRRRWLSLNTAKRRVELCPTLRASSSCRSGR